MITKYTFEDAVANASKHQWVHQYTRFDALEKIIGNRSLRLSRIDTLNDTLENRHMHDLWKKKVYVSCFTHRAYESYFFWKTYAKGCSSGVMLSFRSSCLQGLSIHPDAKCEEPPLEKCNRSELSTAFSPAVDASTWGVFDYSVLDVMYCPRNINLSKLEHFQGRLKFQEWDMECETRIRVAIRPKGIEYQFTDDKQYFYIPGDDYVYAKLPEECLKSMIITISPYADDSLRCKIEQLLTANGLQYKIPIRRSVLTGEIDEHKISLVNK